MVSTRRVMVGPVAVGGGSPVSVQSMFKCDPHDLAASLRQLHRLEREGCQILRMALPDEDSISTLTVLVRKSRIPLVADVHFQPKLALLAIAAGVHKVRINPGNMTREGQRQVLTRAMEARIPVRVGINSGSLPKGLNARNTPGRMLEAVEQFLQVAEAIGFLDLIFSLKASSPEETLQANRLFHQRFGFPLHIGLTEAGPLPEGLVHSVLVCRSLLALGIGDTLRISLSAPPEVEVRAAIALLEGMGLRREGLHLISCPTCGRARLSLEPLLRTVRRIAPEIHRPLTLAVMGCEVNGPGEAQAADIGLTWVQGKVGLFRQGHWVRTVEQKELLQALRQEIERIP
jgi:(E)-4-hydroxy-3-methylbut-2-enyl-diphosphate synthase